MVDVLASLIKPAIPTENTVDMIVGNAKNWGHTTLVILQDHYREGLERMLKDWTEQFDSDWKAAFEVATRWARRNLPRVKQEVLDHAEALIMSCGETRGERNGEGESSEESRQQDDVERTRRPRGRGLSDSQTQFLEEIVQIHSDPVPVVPKQRVPPKQNTKTPPVARDTCTVATMTERRVEDSVKWEGEEIGEGEWDKDSQGARESPKEQRTSRRSQGQIPHPGRGMEMERNQEQLEGCMTGTDSKKGGTGTEEPFLLELNPSTDLDKTPTLKPQVIRHLVQV
ncbi:MAG: hypothetical protein ACRCT3_20770, partial [Aeromonas hydrophila]